MTPETTTWTMELGGEFTMALEPHGQCGWEGLTEFYYHAVVTADKLDASGYVIDALAIGKAFTEILGKGVWAGSCEMIASRAVTLIKSLDKDGRIVAVKAKIGPKGAPRGAECKWTKPFPLPSPAAKRLAGVAARAAVAHKAAMAKPAMPAAKADAWAYAVAGVPAARSALAA